MSKRQPKRTLVLTDRVILDLLMASVEDILVLQRLNVNTEETVFNLEIELLDYADAKYNYFKATDTIIEGRSVTWGGIKFHQALQDRGLIATDAKIIPYFDDCASLILELSVQRRSYIKIEAC